MVTIKDIAKIAGVSHSTVSRSLNDSSEISEKTKERIKKIAEELGFEFNNNARSLSTKKTGTIGIIFDKGFDQENASLFFSKLLKELRYSLERASFDAIIDFRANPFTGKNNIKKLINGNKIDGFIIVDKYIEEEDLKFIKEKKVPTVFVHNRPVYQKKYKLDYVMADHYKGGYLATQYLINMGHKQIITFTHKIYNKEYSEFEERTKGFVKAMEENNLKISEKEIIRDEISFEYGREKIKEIVKKKKKFTAVYAQTDLLALGIIRGLRELNIKVPEEVSVIGYDNIEFGKFSEPELTTINQPTAKLAEEAVKLLTEKFDKKYNEVERKIIVEPNLVLRNSIKKI